MERITPRPGQESVWDYPRPPRVEPEQRTVRVVLGNVMIASSSRAVRVLETSHPPGIYVPPSAFRPDVLIPNPRRSVCEWKGTAQYWDLRVGDETAEAAAWSYADPRPGYESIAGFISVYPGRVDACYLGEELVVAQEGDFYGGWITRDVVGPMKGGRHTQGW